MIAYLDASLLDRRNPEQTLSVTLELTASRYRGRRIVTIHDQTRGLSYEVDAEQLMRISAAAWQIVRPMEPVDPVKENS